MTEPDLTMFDAWYCYYKMTEVAVNVFLLMDNTFEENINGLHKLKLIVQTFEPNRNFIGISENKDCSGS